VGLLFAWGKDNPSPGGPFTKIPGSTGRKFIWEEDAIETDAGENGAYTRARKRGKTLHIRKCGIHLKALKRAGKEKGPAL